MLGPLPKIELKPLVIFGAGASHDLIDESGYKGFARLDHRPPLAKEIFQDNSFFNKIKSKYSNINGLIGVVRKRMESGKSLEEVLEDIQNDPAEKAQFKYQLSNFKIYLADLLANISYQNSNITGNNYHVFFQHLKTACNDCVVVNFNYDYLAQKAIHDVYKIEFNDFNSYYKNNHIKLIHVHGSALWGYYNDEYKLKHGYGSKFFSSPAITIPTISGKNFACPDEHIDFLEEYLPSTNVIIIIGWRGQENHFKGLLDHIHEVHRIIVVGGSEKESNVSLVNSGLNRFMGIKRVYVVGFSKLLSVYTDFRMNIKEEHLF